MNIAISSRVTLSSGAKVVAVLPTVIPNSAIWLIANWISADLPEISVKPWSTPAPKVPPAGACARVMYKAIAQRGTESSGE